MQVYIFQNIESSLLFIDLRRLQVNKIQKNYEKSNIYCNKDFDMYIRTSTCAYL